jgi:hypothetical protein
METEWTEADLAAGLGAQHLSGSLPFVAVAAEADEAAANAGQGPEQLYQAQALV